MSLHKFVSDEGRMIHYGLDLPSGGFFWLEFFTQQEMMDSQNEDEVKSRNEHLTLTEFKKELKEKFNFELDTRQCFDDISHAPEPTALQFLINKRFGYNLQAMLDNFATDLVTNWI